MKEDYPVFVKWSDATDWILDTVEKFPKSVRFTISGRIGNITLNVMEGIIEAIYSKDRSRILESRGRCWLRRRPRDSWRQLEQQCQELPFGESQQEQAGQPEQQPGLPPRQHTKEKTAGFGSFKDGPGVPFVSRRLSRSGGALPDEEHGCRRGR